MIKSNTYEFRLLGLLIGLFILVVLSGGLIYNQLNNIAQGISIKSSPDSSLLLMKDIRNNLTVADNKVNAYTLSEEDTFLVDYYRTVDKTFIKIDALKKQHESGFIKTSDIEILTGLVQKKYKILDTLLTLRNQFRVNDAMNKVVQEINQANLKNSLADIPKPQDKKTLREKIFGPSEETVSTKKSSRSNQYYDLNKEIQQIKEEESKKESTANTTELFLQTKNKSIVLEIGYVLTRMENSILKELEIRALAAKQDAVELSYFLLAFSLLVAALIGVTLYSIFRYIKINRLMYMEQIKAKEQSEELAKTKERFFSNMSHEIRTPLNAISGFAHLLSKEKLPAKQHEKIDIIHKSSLHLTEIINQILDLTKLQHDKMPVEEIPFSFREEMNLVGAILSQSAEKSGINFSMVLEENIPPVLKGDPLKIKQILLNLGSNAIKFTDKGKVQINIQGILVDEKKVQLRIKVIDDGIGIPKNKLDSIFTEFEQAENSTQRKYGGTGLGLAITKNLIALLKGELSVRSNENKGTTFTVNLPVLVGSEMDVVLEESPSFDDLVGKNVLIVDDEPFNRKLLATLLHQNNIFTDEAENGLVAIEKIKSDKFDWVFMDLRMPEMDGIEATKYIRRELKVDQERLFIVALTANTHLLSEKEQKEIGFNGCMQKPFTEKKLLQLVADNSKIPVPIIHSNMRPKYDLSNLKQLSFGDDEFYKEMVQTFMETSSTGLEEMIACVKSKNVQQIRELAHKMCSPCSHLEAYEMQEKLRAIENMAMENSPIEKLKKEIESLHLFLTDLITEMSLETGIPVNKQKQ